MIETLRGEEHVMSCGLFLKEHIHSKRYLEDSDQSYFL